MRAAICVWSQWLNDRCSHSSPMILPKWGRVPQRWAKEESLIFVEQKSRWKERESALA